MKKINLPAWSIAPALLLLCLISYGLLIPKLGFYWDDWPAVWFTKFYGASSLVQVLGIDRPQLAWLYVLTNSIFRDSMAGWQLFSLVMRWVSCLVLWWSLLQIWPKHRTEITWVTFLFAIYPGFRQQYIALIFSHDWIVISLFFLSIGLMILAVRKPKWMWPAMILSWVLAAYAMFADEYYFGLELLRPVLLWMVLGENIPDRRKRLLRTVQYWLPYLGIMLAFMVWRLFLHVSPRGQVQIFNQLAQNPILGAFNLVKTVVLDVIESGLIAWALPFNINEVINSGVTSVFIYLLIAAGVAILTFYFLDRLMVIPSKQEPLAEKHRPDLIWAKQAILLGIFSLFIAGWPFWATSWQIGLTFPWDRFNLAMNFGASLLLTGLLILIFRRRQATIIALAIVIGMASASSFHLGNLYRQDWELVKQFFWQLSWRAPGIQPDTVLLTSRLPFSYSTDNSLTAPLNWAYAPGNRSLDLPYLLFDVATHTPPGWNNINPDQKLHQQYRITDFNGSYARALSVFFRPPNCVKVLDPVIDAELPGKPWYFTAGTAFSNPDLIISNATVSVQPPGEIFGSEPGHDWCYYFEKAELARQLNDWNKVAELADQALATGKQMTEFNALEWIPFIEGFARTGRWQEAEKLSLDLYDVHPKMRRMLCSLWERAKSGIDLTSEQEQTLTRLDQSLVCSAKDD